MRTSTLLATCLATVLPALGFAAGNDKTDMSSQDFVKHAAQANLAEIQVSQLAEQKAQSPDVKQFAQKMIDDHTKASSELAEIAQSKNLKVPDDTDMMHKAAMKMLQAKSGDSFDSAYMEQMNKDHKKVIDMFQSAANAPKVDKDLQAFASKMLPKLEQHHQLVAQVESKMPSMSAAKKSSSTNR
jgi:putative membrane protein